VIVEGEGADLGMSLSLGVVSRVSHKMADWISMPFGVVSRVGQGMGVLDGWRSSKGRGSFQGKYWASHCSQWDCLRKGGQRDSSQITLGFLDHCVQNKNTALEVKIT